jgi:hypothetical protein
MGHIWRLSLKGAGGRGGPNNQCIHMNKYKNNKKFKKAEGENGYREQVEVYLRQF